MTEDNPIVGHKTIGDVTGEHRHVPIRRTEAEAIMAQIDASTKRRAELMPTEQDAVSMMCEAYHRLKELGWKETTYGPTNQTVQLIEAGSSGIHQGQRWQDWPEKTWWIDNNWPSNPCLFKPLGEATK